MAAAKELTFTRSSQSSLRDLSEDAADDVGLRARALALETAPCRACFSCVGLSTAPHTRFCAWDTEYVDVLKEMCRVSNPVPALLRFSAWLGRFFFESHDSSWFVLPSNDMATKQKFLKFDRTCLRPPSKRRSEAGTRALYVSPHAPNRLARSVRSLY